MNSIVSKVQIWDKFKDMKFNDLKIWLKDKKEFFQCVNNILCAHTKCGRMPGPDKQWEFIKGGRTLAKQEKEERLHSPKKMLMRSMCLTGNIIRYLHQGWKLRDRLEHDMMLIIRGKETFTMDNILSDLLENGKCWTKGWKYSVYVNPWLVKLIRVTPVIGIQT